MSKSVQELEQDLAKAREAEQAERHAKREAEAAQFLKRKKLDELKEERASVLRGIDHLREKIVQREKRIAEIDAAIKAAE